MHLGLTRRRVLAGALLSIASPLLGACGSSGSPSPTATTSQAFLAPTATPVPPAPTSTPTTVPTDTPVPSPTPIPSTPTPIPATATPAPQGMSSPDFGVQVFMWGSGEAQRDLSLVNEAGFRWIKQSIEWRYVEPHVKGKLEFNEPDRLLGLTAPLGLKMIARLDNQPVWARSDKIFPASGPPDKNQDYADFVHAVASRYKGKIQAYEIWNEPNLASEWGGQPPDPVAYTALLKSAYEAIKAGDPDALVISAGLAPTTASGAIAMPDIEFTQKMYKAGAAKYFDLLGAHGAGYKAPPDMSPDDVAKNPTYNHGEGAAGRIYCFRHIEDLRNVMVNNGDAKKRLVVLEFGWTVDNRPASPYFWHAVTEQQQADYFVGAYKWAAEHWQPWIGAMSAIYIASPTWTPNDEEYYWAITKPDGSVRPAYTALAGMAK